MRKYLIGALVGITLTLTSSVYADDITSLIGKTVQGVFPVKVNGDTLPKTAIVIDGTSYLPVRAIGDAIGYDVSFNADLGIELKKKEVATMTLQSSEITSSPTPSPMPVSASNSTATPDPGYELEKINTSINGFKQLLSVSESYLKTLTDAGLENTPKADDARQKINDYTAKILDLEKQKTALTP